MPMNTGTVIQLKNPAESSGEGVNLAWCICWQDELFLCESCINHGLFGRLVRFVTVCWLPVDTWPCR